MECKAGLKTGTEICGSSETEITFRSTSITTAMTEAHMPTRYMMAHISKSDM